MVTVFLMHLIEFRFTLQGRPTTRSARHKPTLGLFCDLRVRKHGWEEDGRSYGRENTDESIFYENTVIKSAGSDCTFKYESTQNISSQSNILQLAHSKMVAQEPIPAVKGVPL